MYQRQILCLQVVTCHHFNFNTVKHLTRSNRIDFENNLLKTKHFTWQFVFCPINFCFIKPLVLKHYHLCNQACFNVFCLVYDPVIGFHSLFYSKAVWETRKEQRSVNGNKVGKKVWITLPYSVRFWFSLTTQVQFFFIYEQEKFSIRFED